MDIVTSQLSKAALERVTTTSTPAQQPGGMGSSSFQKVLDLQNTQSPDSVSQLNDFVDNTFGNKNSGPNAVDASSVHVEINKVGEVSNTPSGNYVYDLLKDFNKDQVQFDNIKEMVTSGKSFKPQELLAMQVGVQHLTIQVEMVTKAAEYAVRIPNTLAQTNVG
ncbi:MAG: hypothetical protein U1F57_02635 [bacterium]